MNYKSWLVLIIVVVLIAFAAWKSQNSGKRANAMTIESTVFENNGKIPVLYTCNGDGAQPPLLISNVPENAKSLSLIVDDPDAPNGDFVHWVVWNLHPKTASIENKGVPGAKEGNTGVGKPGYVAPCPPSGTHHYYFKLYALDSMLDLPDGTDKAGLLAGMEGHVIESATLLGLYGKEIQN
jgi:Raf kinase inhibitor-like YbhB/YbcL family protein